MENHFICEKCCFSEPADKIGNYRYCDWYGTYEKPEKNKDCPHYTEKQILD